MGLRRAIFGRLRARPVNRSAPKTPGNLPLSAASGLAESTARMGTGGGSAPRYERSQGWSLGEPLSGLRPISRDAAGGARPMWRRAEPGRR